MVALSTSQTKSISAPLAAWQAGRISIVDLHDNFNDAATSDQGTCRYRLRSTPRVAQSRALIDIDLGRHASVRQKVEFNFELAHVKAAMLPVFSNASPLPTTYGTTSDGSASPSGRAARQDAVLAATKLRAKLKKTSIDSTGESHGPAVWNRHSLHLLNAFHGSYRRNAVAERR